jgi:hypothetical protein
LWLAAAAATALACSSGGSPSDGAGLAPCTGMQTCQGSALYSCVNGQVGTLLHDCAPLSCADSQCTPTACAAADHDDQGFAGCLFYTLIPDNVASDEAKSTSFVIANPGTSPASVALQKLAPAGGGNPPAWSNITSIEVAPGDAGRISMVGGAVTGTGIVEAAALRLMADQPINAIEIDSDDSTLDATSSGGTMLMPTRMLGAHYRVVTYPQIPTGALGIDGSRDGAGRIIVVGTHDRTNVTLQLLPSGGTAAADNVAALPAGQSYSFLLDDGAVFQVYSSGVGADLTGSEVIADGPVAVFSGNITTTYGRAAGSATGGPAVNSPDLAHEQLPPIRVWNTTYVAAQLPPQSDTCDTLLGVTGGSLWRIVAAYDGTQVTFDAGPGVMGLPSSPLPLQAGQVSELLVSGGSFTVTSNSHILLTQGIDCEPSLSLGVGVDHLLADLRFSILPNFDQLVAVVRRSTHPPVMLDDQAIPDSSFVSAGAGFEVAQIELDSCPPSAGACAHHLSGEFAATIRGMDVVCSYAVTGAEWTGCMGDPSDPACILN